PTTRRPATSARSTTIRSRISRCPPLLNGLYVVADASVRNSRLPPREPQPAPADSEPKREPGMPPPGPQWWEEKAKFRHRGPGDYDWADDKQAGYFCEVDYDPFKDISVPSPPERTVRRR